MSMFNVYSLQNSSFDKADVRILLLKPIRSSCFSQVSNLKLTTTRLICYTGASCLWPLSRPYVMECLQMTNVPSGIRTLTMEWMLPSGERISLPCLSEDSFLDRMASGMQFYLDYNTRAVLRTIMRAFDEYYGQDVEWDKLEGMNFTQYFIEEDIGAQANALADELQQDVMEWRMYSGARVPHYLRISSLVVDDFYKVRARAEITNWVADYSAEWVNMIDQVNMILNAGGFTDVLDTRILRMYRRNLRYYFDARNSFNEVIFDQLPVAVSRAYLPLSRPFPVVFKVLF